MTILRRIIYLNLLPETIIIPKKDTCPHCKKEVGRWNREYRFYLFRKETVWHILYRDSCSWTDYKYRSKGKTPEEAGQKMYNYLKRCGCIK